MSNQVEDCFKFLWPFQNFKNEKLEIPSLVTVFPLIIYPASLDHVADVTTQPKESGHF